MVRNKSLIYNSLPHGLPVPGKDLVVKESELDTDSIPEGAIVIKNLYISFDPYQRGRMRDPSIKTYIPMFVIGKPITNNGIGEVYTSKNRKFKKGELITGHVGLENYSVISAEALAGFTKVDNKYNLPLSNYLGALGMPGLTAYASFYKIGQPKKGETIFISAASGAVGQIVGQLAKREGLTVIGSVGSDEKVDFVKNELKFDEAFNYKKITNHEALKKLAPNGINIYFDNVGGEALEAAITAAQNHSRFIMCGMIGDYNAKNSDEITKVNNLSSIVTKRLLLQGFIISDDTMGPRYAKEHFEYVSRWLHDGSFIAKESITEGVENAIEGFLQLFQGKNFGKASLKIIHDE